MTAEAKSKYARPKILVVEGLSNGDVCVEAAGGTAVSLRAYGGLDEVDRKLKEGDFNGVLLTGGGDVDPRLYGQQPMKEVYGISETRDLIEICVLDRARKLGVPVMGICRGAQIMAVEAGGVLKQHISEHRGSQHKVFTERHSYARTATRRPRFEVVSLHHQEIREPGNNMRIVGWAQDGTVEIIESHDGRCIGVQFHPEMDEFEDYAQNLFRWLVLESARRAKMPTPSSRWYMLHHKYRSTKMVGRGDYWSKSTPSIYGSSRAPATSPTVTAPLAVSRPAGVRTEPGRKGALSLVSAWAAKALDHRAAPAPSEATLGAIELAGGGGTLLKPTPGDNKLTISYICPSCSLRFDKWEDREDHVNFEVCTRAMTAHEEVIAQIAMDEAAAIAAIDEAIRRHHARPTFRTRREMIEEEQRGFEYEGVGI